MKAKIIFVLCACFLLGSFLGLWLQDRAQDAKGIASGVWVGEFQLAGLSPEEAQELLTREYQRLFQRTLVIAHGDQTWQLEPEELGVKANLSNLVAEAYKVGREGNLLQRFLVRLQVKKQKLVLEPQLAVDEEKIAEIGAKLAAEIDRRPQNARLEVKGTKVEVVPSVSGKRVEVEKLPDFFKGAVLSPKEQHPLPVEVVSPSLTTEEVRSWGIREQIAGFATRFNPENTGRLKNIKIAAGKLDGFVLMPGEEFSFNKIVGNRGVKEGYAEAPVIIDGELVPGVGGGVCQVSSTLYNVILLAGLKASKRSHHSMPVSYLPIGRDAAVAYDYLDLRFKNTLSSALLFKTYEVEDRLRLALYGPSTKQEISLESIIEEEIPAGVEEKADPSLAPGTVKVLRQGVSGYRVKVWRVFKEGGKVKRRELISSDYYKPVSKIVIKGPEPEKKETVSETVSEEEI